VIHHETVDIVTVGGHLYSGGLGMFSVDTFISCWYYCSL